MDLCSAPGQLPQLLQQRAFRVLRHLPAQSHTVRELRCGLFCSRRIDEQRGPLIQRVIHRHAQFHHAAHRDHLGVLQCPGCGRRIGTHKAAGAQQHTAKIAGHHHDQIGQTAVLQHFQRRGPRRFCRFAIVRVAFPVAFPQAVGIYIVPRGPVGCTHLFQKCNGGFLTVRKRQGCNEAALLLFVFSCGRATNRAVILHGGSSCFLFRISIT